MNDKAKQLSAAIAYDVCSKSDAETIADLLSASGIKVYLFTRQTPELSYVVRKFKCGEDGGMQEFIQVNIRYPLCSTIDLIENTCFSSFGMEEQATNNEDLTIAIAEKLQYDIIIGNRLGVLVRDSFGKLFFLNGNQVNTILMEYLKWKELGKDSISTMLLISEIAAVSKYYGKSLLEELLRLET